jgi:hypothetical protein
LTVNWFLVLQLFSIAGLLKIVVVIMKLWTVLMKNCCIHRSKSLLKRRSSGISRYSSLFNVVVRSRLII